MIEIRKAKDEDCEKLAVLKRQIWETTYRGIYPDDKLDNYHLETHQKKFAEMMKRQSLFVATDGDLIIGYASCGPILRPFDNHQYDIGLLYLKEEYQGQGVGKALFNRAKEELARQGADEFIVSCNKYNLKAQGFYEAMGGEIVKVEEDQVDKSVPQVKFIFR